MTRYSVGMWNDATLAWRHKLDEDDRRDHRLIPMWGRRLAVRIQTLERYMATLDQALQDLVAEDGVLLTEVANLKAAVAANDNAAVQAAADAIEAEITRVKSVDDPAPAPVDTPPADNPPVDTPPADNPPVDTPPATDPSTDTPPAADPSAPAV